MKNAQATAATPAELLHDLQALVSEAEAMMAESGTARSAPALDDLRARFSAAQERFTEMFASARKHAVAGARCTDAAIRENPYQALALATGIGLLVGVLVGRGTK